MSEQQVVAAYERHRSIDEIKELAKIKGFTVDSKKHDEQGHDHVVVYMPGPNGRIVPVLYNTFNGRFFHAPAQGEQGVYFTSDRPDHDGYPWFDAMLDFFLVKSA